MLNSLHLLILLLVLSHLCDTVYKCRICVFTITHYKFSCSPEQNLVLCVFIMGNTNVIEVGS